MMMHLIFVYGISYWVTQQFWTSLLVLISVSVMVMVIKKGLKLLSGIIILQRHSFTNSVSYQGQLWRKVDIKMAFQMYRMLWGENVAWQRGVRRLACWHVANNKQENRLKSSQHTCNLFWRMIYLRTVFFFEKNPVHTCVFSNTTIPIWDKTRRWYFEYDACKSFEKWKSGKENKQVLKLGGGVNTNRARYESMWLKNKKAVGLSESTHSIS